MHSGKTLLLIALVLFTNVLPSIACFTAIFSFGDSIADTGNKLISVGGNSRSGRLPYGETYFGHPSGRFSDGRLIVDFISQAVGLPLLRPYLAEPFGHKDFRRGVNFAVEGATALNNDFFREKGMNVSWTNYSLGTQMKWFKKILPSLCFFKQDCDDIMNNSLFLMGEIGGNDYNHPFFQQRTIDEIRTFVPSVIKTISSAIDVLIELGAKTIMVPGNFPIGCIPVYLTVYKTERREDYDPQTGCIKWLNEFSEYHNTKLKDELDRLRQQHSDVTIIYADYYQSLQNIFQSSHKFGFERFGLKACCGGGGPYNYNLERDCGSVGFVPCDDPSKCISWDGIHMTEAVYKIVADGLINGPYAVPSIGSFCSNKAIHLLNKVPNPVVQERELVRF